ncbi:MAG: zf-HC2 domain-containing protein, partial [Planctomycetota bacterium]|nr:zf-HC2 domain-containing protein [Planctomycetota bacterium]
MNENGYTNDPGICEGVLDLLPLYEGGELEIEQEGDLREHLDACTACHAQWVVGKKAIAMRQEAWTQDAGKTPDLWTGVQSQLRAEGLTGQASVVEETRGNLLRFPALRFVAAAAALVAIVAVGSQFMGAGPGSSDLPNGGNLVAENERATDPIVGPSHGDAAVSSGVEAT